MNSALATAVPQTTSDLPPPDISGAAPDKDAAKPARTLGPLRMIWRETIKYPRQAVFALVALVITASATLAIPAGFHLIIDRGFARGGNPAEIGRWFRYLLLIVAVLGLGTAVRFYFVSWLGERVVADIRLKVQANLMRQSPAFFEANSPNEISSRMTSDTTLVEQVVGTTASVALRNSIMALGGIIRLFLLAPKLTGGLVLGIMLVVFPLTFFGRRLRNVSRTSQDRVADIGALVAEVLGAMRVVQAFNQERRELDRFGTAVEATFATARRRLLEAKLSAEPPPHPHGIYQYRRRVGTAGPHQHEQEGELVFLWLQGGQDFNATIPFEYRDMTLMLERWGTAKSVWHGGSAHSTEYRPATGTLIN